LAKNKKIQMLNWRNKIL